MLSRAKQLTATLQQYSLPLIVGVVAGLVVANIDDVFYQKLVFAHVFGDDAEIFGHALTAHFLINEVFMVSFFGIAAKEIVESTLPGGSLNPMAKAVNPLVGTLGGVLGPAGLYFLLTYAFYGGTDDFSVVAKGWAIPTATDIALAWLVARLAFGDLHPAVDFLLLLAVADDAIGLGIIAVFYPDPEHPAAPIWLLLIVGGMAVALVLRLKQVNSWIPYVAIGGALSWFGLLKASLAPALTLVPIVPFLPAHSAKSEAVRVADNPDSDPNHGHAQGHRAGPLQRFEHDLKLFVDFGLFFFAFANAGVPFGSIGPVTAIVVLSLIVGKTVGISLFSWAAAGFGFPLPTGMSLKHLAVASLIAGLGLTVALFVADKAFSGPPFLAPAKMGAVLSGSVAVLALIAGRLLKVKDAQATE